MKQLKEESIARSREESLLTIHFKVLQNTLLCINFRDSELNLTINIRT